MERFSPVAFGFFCRLETCLFEGRFRMFTLLPILQRTPEYSEPWPCSRDMKEPLLSCSDTSLFSSSLLRVFTVRQFLGQELSWLDSQSLCWLVQLLRMNSVFPFAALLSLAFLTSQESLCAILGSLALLALSFMEQLDERWLMRAVSSTRPALSSEEKWTMLDLVLACSSATSLAMFLSSACASFWQQEMYLEMVATFFSSFFFCLVLWFCLRTLLLSWCSWWKALLLSPKMRLLVLGLKPTEVLKLYSLGSSFSPTFAYSRSRRTRCVWMAECCMLLTSFALKRISSFAFCGSSSDLLILGDSKPLPLRSLRLLRSVDENFLECDFSEWSAPLSDFLPFEQSLWQNCRCPSLREVGLAQLCSFIKPEPVLTISSLGSEKKLCDSKCELFSEGLAEYLLARAMASLRLPGRLMRQVQAQLLMSFLALAKFQFCSLNMGVALHVSLHVGAELPAEVEVLRVVARQSLAELQDLAEQGHLAGDDAALGLGVALGLLQLVALVVLAEPNPGLALLGHEAAAQVCPALAQLRQQRLVTAEHDLQHVQDLLQAEPFRDILQSAHVILKVHEFFPGPTPVLTGEAHQFSNGDMLGLRYPVLEEMPQRLLILDSLLELEEDLADVRIDQRIRAPSIELHLLLEVILAVVGRPLFLCIILSHLENILDKGTMRKEDQYPLGWQVLKGGKQGKGRQQQRVFYGFLEDWRRWTFLLFFICLIV